MSERKGDLLAYVRSNEVSVIRCKHRIGFRSSYTALDLVQLLRKLPPYVTVAGVKLHEDDIVTIEFHEETAKGGE